MSNLRYIARYTDRLELTALMSTNPSRAKLASFNPLEVMARYRKPSLQGVTLINFVKFGT